MPYLIGLVLALAVFLFARFTGFDRERAFYPTVTIVVAQYYGLFALMGGSMTALALESIAIAGLIVLAVLGFRLSPWFAVAGLSGHGIYDFFHGHLITNPGVPTWWPAFCLTYDVATGAGLAWLLLRRRAAALAP
jgi:hypothetical protein